MNNDITDRIITENIIAGGTKREDGVYVVPITALKNEEIP